MKNMKNKMTTIITLLLIGYGFAMAFAHYFAIPDIEEVRIKKIPPGVEWFSEQLPKYKEYPVAQFSHVILSIALLGLMPFQLYKKIREKSFFTHRLMGYLYLLLGVVIGSSGIYISIRFPFAGLRESIGIVPVSLFFMFSIYKGIVYAKEKNFTEHRIWMIRSIASALAPMTMRMIFGTTLILTGIEPKAFFTESFIIGFCINMAFVEFYIKKQKFEFSKTGHVLEG